MNRISSNMGRVMRALSRRQTQTAPNWSDDERESRYRFHSTSMRWSLRRRSGPPRVPFPSAARCSLAARHAQMRTQAGRQLRKRQNACANADAGPRRKKKGNKDGQRSKAAERYPVTQLRREGQRGAPTRPSSYLKFTLPAPLLISTLTPLIKGSCIGAIITMKWVKEGVYAAYRDFST